MFSIMTTVPSMMMPKSMAPIESRLAATSWACSTIKANSSDERNGEGDNDGGAEADQKEDQHDQHQHHAAKQVVLHRVGGQLDQFAAIVKGMDLYVRRQNLPVQFLGLGLDALQNVLRLLAAQHENDAFDRVVIFLEAEFTQTRRVADRHIADVADPNRNAVVAADHDVADVVGIAHQADAAHVVELAALRIESAAGVGVIGGQRVHDLRNREVVAVNAGGIEQHLVLHHRAAEAGVVGHAGNRAVGALDHPILDGLQLLRACDPGSPAHSGTPGRWG